MYPVLFRIGDFAVTSFGVMMALSFLVGGWILSKELKRKGENPDVAWEVVWWAAIGGIVGARLYYLILTWPHTIADPWGAITSRGGLVWYGGFIGAALLIYWRLKKSGVAIPRVADAVAPALAVAYAIGRLGCFLVGDDYGRPTDLPWAIAFPNGAPPSTAENLREQFGIPIPPGVPGDTVMAVHPTQLYEIAMSLLIFAIIWRLRERIAPAGALFCIYVALAGVERFIVEIFRAKDDRFFGAFTMAQLISLALVAVGIAGATYLLRRRSDTSLSGAEAPERARSRG
ncbi:MAG TPA: prolipoprotein diacylglyceryl transferase [Longimicrobiaceae bacterium]